MALEPPESGQVIRYPYLWHREHSQGHEEGRKIRPNIVLYDRKAHGKTRIYLLPMSTKPPSGRQTGLEVPREIKQHLRLDASRVWVIASELNHFEWPGADVRARNTDDITVGFVPEQMIERLREMARERHHTQAVNRDINPREILAQLRQSQSIARAQQSSTHNVVADARQQSQKVWQHHFQKNAYSGAISRPQSDAKVPQPRRVDQDLGL